MIKERYVILLLILAFIVIGVGSTLLQTGFDRSNGDNVSVITNFNECAFAGYPVMESYPRQCRTPDGKLFVEKIDRDQIPSDEYGYIPGEIGCIPAGCSSQLCLDADIAPTITTTCEWRDEYMCYRKAACERQKDGQCGWTMTDELRSCIDETKL